MLYTDLDRKREYVETDEATAWRPSFIRDYGRIVHSPSFRRLQGKTQVFPGNESDFFRNRLTHSLEVSQIAEGIAERLNYTDPNLLANGNKIDGRLCAIAALAHDLGHPPFGHNGEHALDVSMREHGGFEGNAQTLRILTRLEKKIRRPDGSPLGLGLCYRTLAAILKYDKQIPRSRRDGEKLVKGYYWTESELVKDIKSAVCPDRRRGQGDFKTIECSIMDLADDIAYSTFDLEDSMKAGFLTPSDILCSDDRLLAKVSAKVSEKLKTPFTPASVLEVFTEIFEPDFRSVDDEGQQQIAAFRKRHGAYRDLANDGHFRTALSSELIKKALNSVSLKYNQKNPVLSEVYLSKEARERVEVLKQYTYMSTIYSSRVKLPEYRGYDVVQGIFKALSSSPGFLLLPDDVREQYDLSDGDLDVQMRLVCDFVAGMTDRYAIEFYGRLYSDTAQSMFKPL